MNIVVFLGANYSNNPLYTQEAIKLGAYIGTSHNTLVYGGSKTGLMGELANSVLNSNGKVIGVQLKKFVELGYDHKDLNELIVEDTMSLRINKMIKLGDIFIAFPGGTGTLEEISEVMSKSSLKEINNKVIIYNLNHYYDDLYKQIEKMKKEGFSNEDRLSNLYFPSNLDELIEIINN